MAAPHLPSAVVTELLSEQVGPPSAARLACQSVSAFERIDKMGPVDLRWISLGANRSYCSCHDT